jgi:hypothetical protein
VLLSTPLHASSNFTVSVQLANKRGFTIKLYLNVLSPHYKVTILAESVVFVTGALMFYGTGLACCALFLKLGTKWPELAVLWQRTEYSQIRYGYPTNLRMKIRTLTVIILTLALGEYKMLLYQYVLFILETMMRLWNLDLI